MTNLRTLPPRAGLHVSAARHVLESGTFGRLLNQTYQRLERVSQE
jgi:hypothetical protein